MRAAEEVDGDARGSGNWQRAVVVQVEQGEAELVAIRAVETPINLV